MGIEYEKFTTFDNINLSVKIQNNGKSEKILLLHGFNDSKETFQFIEKFLSEKFDIVSFDFRGHGDSDWKMGVYNYSDTLLDLHLIIENYFLEPFTVLGHSMGSSLAARYSGLFPEKVKKLVCIEGFSGIQSMHKEREKIQTWMNKKNGQKQRMSPNARLKEMDSIKEAVERLSLIYSKLEKSKVEKLVLSLIKKLENGKFVWKNDPNLKLSSPIPFPPELSRALWSNFSNPSLIVFGKETHLKSSNIDEVIQNFKNPFYVEIEGAGHNVHHDKPEELIRVLKEFLG
ncbi:MAG: alpha/beta hydrolase [Leptospiraceae bacterium]|nr:alpha/beta hydrolase [Leptospiraceae bacterium]MCK6381561.1 alpha/beta hydrolase [Leptospiraceae bacterium]NUM42148.1 alpha/beta hydrolase [Leptospiraceae bacterium]